MRQTWKDAGKGFVLGLAVAAAAGALWGAFFGVQLYIDDGRPFHRYAGTDGAYVGALMGLVLGGLPAGLLGAVAGVPVGRRARRRKVPFELRTGGNCEAERASTPPAARPARAGGRGDAPGRVPEHDAGREA